MLKIALPNTAIVTSRLGFGGAELFGGRSKARSFALLDAAIESGITHFDVAPSYALGMAEEVLGEFLYVTGANATVATKYGMPSRKHGKILSDVRLLAKALTSKVPYAHKLLRGAVKNSAPRQSFIVSEIRQSLTLSLQKLKKERVDVFLLHEPKIELMRDGLFLEIEELISAGVIGAAGVGGHYDSVIQVADTWPGCLKVIQHQLPSRTKKSDERFYIFFGAIQFGMARLNDIFSDQEKKERILKTVDIDLHDPAEKGRVAIAMSLIENPTGIVLFSSKNPSRIREIGSVLTERKLLNEVNKLVQLI